jgi:hypothetical protein
VADQVPVADMVMDSNTARINALDIHGQASEIPEAHISMKKFSLRGDKELLFNS